jgi:hypothetical protein
MYVQGMAEYASILVAMGESIFSGIVSLTNLGPVGNMVLLVCGVIGLLFWLVVFKW